MTASDAAKTDATGPKRRAPWWVWAIHVAIILNLLVEFVYASWIVMVVLAPETGGGPLFDRVHEVPHELLEKRRLYAIEAWIAFSGLAVYLGVTEIGPRLKGER